MDVTYQLEREDYWSYYQFIFKRVPGWKWKTYLLPLLIPIYLIIALWISHAVSVIWLPFLGAAVYGIFVAGIAWLRKRVWTKAIAASPGALGLHTLALGKEGIRHHSPVMEAVVNWPKVTDIAENNDLIVFLLGPRSGFLIPKRTFPTAEGAQAFLETARAYHQSALNGTPLVLPEAPQSWPPAPQRSI